MPDLHEHSAPTAPHTNGNLEELQNLLLAAERGRLDRLEDDLNKLDDRLKNKVVDATAVANVLPDAICLRAKQDQHLKESLAPTIVQTLMYTVRKSPKPVVDAIYPVMGPAIRKYIEDALQGMVRRLDHSGLSWRGFSWRWEAWRTGRSFGDVALLHTLRYQVERVFLFFREDGIHLADVHLSDAPALGSGHEDLVTSMFSEIQTAVQKFAQDEFQVSEHSSMKEIKMDGKTVFIEQGPKAVLAAVVRGIPPQSLRHAFQNALESIHVEFSEALQKFRGDKKPFEAARPHLEACLFHKESDSSREMGSSRGGLSPMLMVVLLVLLTSLSWWVVTSYLNQQPEADEQLRWAHFLEKARGKPGIQITHTQTADGKNGKTIVYGLRDPISDDPQKIAQEVGLPHEMIDFRLEPYLSLAPELIERRAHDNRQRLDQLVQEIEAHHFDFEVGSASLSAESELALQSVLQAIRKSNALALQLGSRLQVEIHGNTSEEGSAEINRRLARARAQRILSALNVERFPATDFLSVAESDGHSASAELQDSKPQRARRVSFHVTVDDSGSTRLRR